EGAQWLRRFNSGLWCDTFATARCAERPTEGRRLMLKEFREFVMKGNVVDLAVSVIFGAAFGKIVDSLVSDIIMPIIGAIPGGLDFSNYYLAMSSKVQAGLAYADAKKSGAVLG